MQTKSQWCCGVRRLGGRKVSLFCDPTPETDGEGLVQCQCWYTLAGTKALHAEPLAENDVEGTETRELDVCYGGQAERKFKRRERELMERFLVLGKARDRRTLMGRDGTDPSALRRSSNPVCLLRHSLKEM